MVSGALALHACAMLGVGAYALLKEREELGCTSVGIKRQCDDDSSVFVRGTAPEASDTRASAKAKLVSILSYHEKGAVWRRCFLMASLLAYLSFVVVRGMRCAGEGWSLAVQHLVFLAVLYFYWNYLNYHHFRRLKANGVALLHAL